MLSQGEKTCFFFLRLANALKQFDLPNLGPWSALANPLACPPSLSLRRGGWACPLFEKLP